METNCEKRFKWVTFSNWGDIQQTFCDHVACEFLVCEKDVDNYVKRVFKLVSYNLNIRYDELIPILEEENKEFIKSKSDFFSTFKGIKKSLLYTTGFSRMLKIPYIETKLYASNSNTERLLLDFSELTNDEQQEVLKRLCIRF